MRFSLLILLATASIAALANGKEVRIAVKGMVCGFCAQGITRKFKADPAVETIDVSLENKLVKIGLKDGQNIDDAKIEKILTEAGYNIEKIERADK